MLCFIATSLTTLFLRQFFMQPINFCSCSKMPFLFSQRFILVTYMGQKYLVVPCLGLVEILYPKQFREIPLHNPLFENLRLVVFGIKILQILEK